MRIAKVAIPSPLRKLFDYLLPKECATISPGTRVLVPFGKRTLIGIVVECNDNSSIPQAKLKTICEILDEAPIFPDILLKLLLWSSQYYHHPLGDILFTGLPAGLRKNNTSAENKSNTLTNNTSLTKKTKATKPINDYTSQVSFFKEPKLNLEQETAIKAMNAAQNIFQVFLLNGITGSGKTEVYLQVMAHYLITDAQILFLVPEISLTPQTITRIQQRFAFDVVQFHSHLTDKQRLTVWQQVNSQKNIIVIGTRSALFLPFNNLKLIVIDEEHDSAFKQQNNFRYHARDLAIMRANYGKIPLILGSATPSFETIANVKQNKYIELVLNKRAGVSVPPKFEILDIRHKKLTGGLSSQLIAKIKSHLNNNGQVLLFLNRRGYAPAFMCFDCGNVFNCKRCDAKLTLHLEFNQLLCHHCNKQQPIPKTCAQCKSANVNAIGAGTERIEETLREQFKDLPIARIDSDNTRPKGSMEKMLEEINSAKTKLLIGTQMLAKGHHFANLTLVAIIDADAGLFSTDFRALEKMGQLITQVAGRAGREAIQGEVIIQTHHPEHHLLHQLIYQGYTKFSEELLKERQQIELPPYTHLAMLRAEAKQQIHAENLLKDSAMLLRQKKLNVQILGPVLAPMAKRNGNYRMQLLLKSQNRKDLHHALTILTTYLEQSSLAKKVRWSLDVDPIDTM